MAEKMTPQPGRKAGRSVPVYYYAIGVAGVAVAYFLYRRNKTAATTAAATTATGTTATTDTTGTAATPTAASTAGDQATTAADIISAIQAMQGPGATPLAPGTTTPTPSTTTFTAPSNVKLEGAGYGSTGPITNAAGNVFRQFAGAQKAADYVKTGGTIYYQPQPGVFQKVKNTSTLPKGTPYYSEVG